jgi:hypothetical protein
MIASRTGLAIAAAIACVLAIVLALELRRDTGPVERAIAPGFDADRVTALAWRKHGSELRIVRAPHGGWTWVAPPGVAETRTVEDVLATLRGARWHRRTDPAAAGELGDVLVVQAGSEAMQIAIGQPLAGGEQQWIVIGDHALLVDAWVARGLDPDPVALRVRAPLARAAEATGLAIDDLVLHGSPRQLVRGTTSLVVAPALVDELERALIALTVVELPPAQVHPAPTTQIRLDGKLAVALAGACPDHDRLLIDGPTGVGCVEHAAWTAIEQAAAAFAGPLEQLVDRRPVPGEAARITLTDHAILDLAKRPRLGDRDADPARVVELLAVLASPAEPVALPTTAPIGQLEVVTHDGLTVTLDLYARHTLARHGEPIALQVGEGAAAILARPGAALVDPTLWHEEPTTISALAIDDTTYTRGAVVGEWTRSGPGRDDPAAVEQLAKLLAAPRAPTPGKPGGARRRITLTVTPPSGPPATHTLTLALPCPDEVCKLVQRLRP